MPPLGDRRTYLPRIVAPRWVVFADFDETYLAHDGSPERRRDRRSLEQLLLEEAASLGLVFGWVFAGHQLGAATAAFGAGYFRSDFNTYMPALQIAGVMCMLAAVSVLLLNRPGSVKLAPQAG